VLLLMARLLVLVLVLLLVLVQVLLLVVLVLVVLVLIPMYAVWCAVVHIAIGTIQGIVHKRISSLFERWKPFD